MTPDEAIASLGHDPVKAAEMHAYHKVDRPYLGVANPVIDAHVKGWRAAIDLDTRLALAKGLWDSNIHEARVAAAKLLTQARIRPDDQQAWDLITSWVPSFDAWAVADHACMAGQRRLIADPSRLDEVERWTTSDHLWTKRAALVMTLPWTKQNHPKPAELEARDRVLCVAERCVGHCGRRQHRPCKRRADEIGTRMTRPVGYLRQGRTQTIREPSKAIYRQPPAA